MAARGRQYREIVPEGSRLLTAGWSHWEQAMVPLDRGLDHRGNPDQEGLMCSSIKTAFPIEAKCCGIYEWAAVGTFLGQPDHVVVYVGSTCRDKPGALRRRILEYCNNGSHNKDLINEALERGYEFWVRVKIVTGCHPYKEDAEVAEDMENKLLDRYDYAWNVRRNGRVRNILP